MIQLEARVKELHAEQGGRIFVLPVEPENPHSKYVISMVIAPGRFNTYPTPLTIEEAASGVLELLEGLKEAGEKVEFDRDVKFVLYEPQMNAPNVTMRRLKKGSESGPGFVKDIDVSDHPDDPDQKLFSARGIIKVSFLEMLGRNPKGAQFMDGYYRLLASRRYGKTAAAIKQEVRRLGKAEGLRWVESTYKRFIREDREIMNLMASLKGATT